MDVIISLGSSGKIRGARDSHGVCRFLGIPYAQPPTGQRRWQKPVLLQSDYKYGVNGEPRDCSKFGDICAQEIYVIDGEAFNKIPGANVSLVAPLERKFRHAVTDSSTDSILKTVFSSIFGHRRRNQIQARAGQYLCLSMEVGCKLETHQLGKNYTLKSF